MAGNIADMLKIRLKDKNGDTKGPSEGIELLSFYFSAHWCPPCRGFTPKLVECYNKVNANGKKWEIVFVSLDRTKSDFEGYYSEMPWMTMPFEDEEGDKDARETMCGTHSVRGIPALVLLNPDGSVKSADGRKFVEGDPNGQKFPW